MATQVLKHRCDQWASVDAWIVWQDSPRVSLPQAILKLRPPSILDYKARHGPQTCYFTLIWTIFKRQLLIPNQSMHFCQVFAQTCLNWSILSADCKNWHKRRFFPFNFHHCVHCTQIFYPNWKSLSARTSSASWQRGLTAVFFYLFTFTMQHDWSIWKIVKGDWLKAVAGYQNSK